jgi:hypothetical protein
MCKTTNLYSATVSSAADPAAYKKACAVNLWADLGKKE